jgi:hypothetical protein
LRFFSAVGWVEERNPAITITIAKTKKLYDGVVAE